MAIDAGTVISVVPSTAFGLNTEARDAHLLDAAAVSRLRSTGVTMLRYPGGSFSDTYHWATNSSTPGYEPPNPRNTFDAFMHLVRSVGGQPLLTVNYGTNPRGTGGADPAEAAAWVRYANHVKHYGARYWEIGNEVYGDGVYGSQWEVDYHAQKGPAAYARNAAAFIAAMKAADPSIKVGIPLITPGLFPDGMAPDWNATVLKTLGARIDFVVIKWFTSQNPGSESDAGLLRQNTRLTSALARLRALLNTYGHGRAGKIAIMVSEANSVPHNPGKQTVGPVNALFLADTYMTLLEQGVANVDWWALHDGIATDNNNAPALAGSSLFGDYGLLSLGQTIGSVREPSVNTPFAPYFGLEMLLHVAAAGDSVVRASSDSSMVAAHAARRRDGTLAILLINRDGHATLSPRITVSGFRPAATGTLYTYLGGATAILARGLSGFGAHFRVSLPPFAMAAVVLAPVR